jgi:putative tryptophan/tyrosine transport system substrate-binding protein
MKRRDFIIILSGASAAWPFATRAQEAGRTYRLGGLSAGPRDAPYFLAMFENLRRLGFIEGQNLTVYWQSFALHADRVSDFAADLVKADVDVILASGDLATRAAQGATQSIPILATSDDIVRSGLVNSLARPEGNTTGISMFSTELDGKRQEILIEAVPGLRRMAALSDSATTALRQLQALQEAARTRNVELSILRIARPEEIATAIDAAKAWGAAALNVLASPVLFGNRHIVLERVAALRLPAIYQFPEVAQDGGCLAYGPRLVKIFGELVTRQLVKLLRGAKPANVPVEQPTKFDLVINLKTAKALGLTIPPTLLATADEVIE